MPSITKLPGSLLDETSNFTFANATVSSNLTSGNANLGNLVVANYFSGNGSLLTGLPAGYANSNVADYLPIYTGNITAGNISATGNISANYVLGNGSQLTGLPEQYGNSNVANYLPTYTGNVAANYFIGNGSTLTSLTGANVTGTVSSATTSTTAGTVTTAAQPNITSTGTLTSLSVTGNTTSAYFIGDGSTLSSITGGNVSGQVANALIAGTVYVNAQPNITSTGTLTSLSVSGSAVISGNLTVDGNLVYVNVDTLAVEDPIIQLQTGPNGAAPSSNSGKDVGTALNYYDSQAQIAFMGWDVSNAEFGMASQASISSEVVTFTNYGNLRVGNIIGNGQALTSLTGGNVTGQVANALIAGTVYTAAQPNVTSVGTLAALSVTGLITATSTGIKLSNVQDSGGTVALSISSGNLSVYNNITAGSSGAGNVTASYFVGDGSALTSLTGGSVTGQVGNALIAGTVYTNAQPNITSVGTLASLNVTGNISSAANVTGSYILGNGSALTGIATSTTAVTVTGNAQPNITSVGTLTTLSVTGNVSGNYFIGNGSALTGISGGTSNARAFGFSLVFGG
jgi:hypothetical protein